MNSVCAWCGQVLGHPQRLPACTGCGGFALYFYRDTIWYCWHCRAFYDGGRGHQPGDPQLRSLEDIRDNNPPELSHGICPECRAALQSNWSSFSQAHSG